MTNTQFYKWQTEKTKRPVFITRHHKQIAPLQANNDSNDKKYEDGLNTQMEQDGLPYAHHQCPTRWRPQYNEYILYCIRIAQTAELQSSFFGE